MTKYRKTLLTILSISLPILLFAEEVQKASQQITVWSLLLSTKYIVGFILIIAQLIILYSNKIDYKIRLGSLVVSFLAFGIYFPLHPSPICAFTKPFIYGLRTPFLAGIIFIGSFSIISSKGFCGTICPAGAVQELFYKSREKFKIKLIKPSFMVSNIIRVLFLTTFFLVFLTTGATIFAYFNLFELFHWSFEMPLNYLIIFIVSLVIILGASFFMYRPFCYFTCPVGLVTWLLEQVSILKVRVDKDKCTSCGACENDSPCPAIHDIMDEKKFRADCHLCGECMNTCPENALYYGLKKK